MITENMVGEDEELDGFDFLRIVEVKVIFLRGARFELYCVITVKNKRKIFEEMNLHRIRVKE